MWENALLWFEGSGKVIIVPAYNPCDDCSDEFCHDDSYSEGCWQTVGEDDGCGLYCPCDTCPDDFHCEGCQIMEEDRRRTKNCQE